MPYFNDHYLAISYPLAAEGQPGLYNAQIGAIHELASYFTLHDKPAVVTMPTGSGKTAVLMMVPYVLRVRRVLVVTPSRLVREQIAADFSDLSTLTDIGVLDGQIPKPVVKEQHERITSPRAWTHLEACDVVVSTPNCTSPGYLDIPTPPEDLFELVLIDEAHHSPASTWRDLLDAFPKAKKVLFTATPFRRDRREIEGRFAYSYPLAKAFGDKIFGHIRYVPVPDDGADQDYAVATKTAEVFANDRAAGLNHFVMVRTDRRTRAKELLELYRAHTPLRLELVHSELSRKTVSKIVGRLRDGQLDGVVCVNMMGEGFNFPHLKIAAIHAPHKSLEVTLQFIGRFARTNATDIGEAKFVAARSELEIDGTKFFDASSVWHEIIIGLSEGRVAKELRVREVLERFDQPQAEEGLTDLSLYSLHPRSHVKIYDTPADLELPDRIDLPGNVEVAYESINEERDTIVVITRARSAPKWSDSDKILDVGHDLLVVHHDRASSLLFINSSRSSEGLYRHVVDAISEQLSPIATSLTKRVIKGLTNQRIFNLGMRNILATNQAESYKTLAGPNTQSSVKPSDSLNYRQGHAFISGEEGGAKKTIGYSSLSKVWATAQLQLPELMEWCAELGTKIRSQGEIVTNSGLDYLSAGDVLESIPTDIIAVMWNEHAFDYMRPVEVRYQDDAGQQRRFHIADLELRIDRAQTSDKAVAIEVTGEGLTYPITFTLDEFFTTDDDPQRVQVSCGQQTLTLLEYLDAFGLDFFPAGGGLVRGNEYFAPKVDPTPIDMQQVEAWDWTGTDIEEEINDVGGQRSIQTHVRDYLLAQDDEIAVFDHGTGEVADFVTFKREGTVLTARLYHCKASDEEPPGARLKDVIEVCSQAQRSTPWRGLEALRRKLTSRNPPFIKGDRSTLLNLFEEAKTLRFEMEVVVVQPGISKARLSRNLLLCLGATNDHLVNAACYPLRIIASV